MLKRYAIRRRGALAFATLFALSTLITPLARAEGAADAASAAKAKAPAAGKAAAAKPAPKKARPPKPPRPPEKSYAEQRAEDGPWAKHTNWLSFRAGYAKASGAYAGDGLYGYGIGYQRMLSRRWAFGSSAQYDLLGHLADSYEISVPMTVEFTRHFRWNTAVHPYLGFGGGYYFHKYYRTGNDDTGAPGSGWYLTGGFNLPVADRHVLGLDTRVSFVSGRVGVTNPVFGAEVANEVLWSVKLNWALAY